MFCWFLDLKICRRLKAGEDLAENWLKSLASDGDGDGVLHPLVNGAIVVSLKLRLPFGPLLFCDSSFSHPLLFSFPHPFAPVKFVGYEAITIHPA